MSATRCELTELLIDQCAHCQGHSTEPELESPEVFPIGGKRVWVNKRPVIPSRWPNKCMVCEEWWSVGDLITPLSPNSKKWIHADCAKEG